jgi:5-methylcytosine-specific restriction endonuclease McrA
MANYRKGQPDKRGGSDDRARRKSWMLHWFGDGTTCECVHCGRKLTKTSIEADRIIPGGSYARRNIQPSCGPCNRRRGDSPITPFRPTMPAMPGR